jgi:flagellin-like protein
MRRRRLKSRRAVSEVIGALLLILVVVIAVASFSLFLSTTQANAQSRQLLLTSVANEKLQVVNLQLFPSDSFTEFEFAVSYQPFVNIPGNTTTIQTIFYAHYVDQSDIMIYNGTDFYHATTSRPFFASQNIGFPGVAISLIPGPTVSDTVSGYTPGAPAVVMGVTGGYTAGAFVGGVLKFTSGADSGESFAITANTVNTITLATVPATMPATGDAFSITPQVPFYNFIKSGTNASVTFSYDAITGALKPTGSTIEFGLDVTNNTQFVTAMWGNVNLIVRNLNTQASGLSSISFNGIFPRNFTSEGISYSLGNYLTIPARVTANVTVDLTPLKISKTSPLTILLVSRAGNVFTTVYGPPTPIVKASIVPENYQVLSRDIVTLDGSQSAANSNATIQNYIWETDVPEAGWSGSWSDVAHLATNYTSGSTIQYRPESFFTQASINSLGLQITGPIRVTLIAVDSNGMISFSQPTVIPKDANIAPEGSIALTTNGGACHGSTETLTFTVSDIFGRGFVGAPVLLVPVGASFAVSPSFTVTGSGGLTPSISASGCAAAGDILEIESGSLPPLYVTLS